MSSAIVITTIFEPSEGVKRFAALRHHRLVIVGDRKTPPAWRCDGARFLALEEQQALAPELDRRMPLDHYCRKMFGYLYAMREGAQLIVDTDDDNIPKAGFGFPPLEGAFAALPGGLGFVNVYRYFTPQKIWPRGLPLRCISGDVAFETRNEQSRIGIWQALADEDPDVDAIYRLTGNTPCWFDQRAPLVLGEGTLAPLNSQNTLFRRELFALLYLPTHVTFRFTDILRGLVAQPILWRHGYRVGFTQATVVQKRNAHDYFKDFVSEIPMYRYAEEVPEIVAGALRGYSLADNLYEAYVALERRHIVEKREPEVLSAWLAAVRECQHETV